MSILPPMQERYILGLNQYTHSASACLLDMSGEPVFALAKERVTRKKHDGGDNAEVIEALLQGADVAPEQIELVVANNHLFRIGAFEKNLDWAVALNQHPPGYTSKWNLLPGVAHHELSHHLAHAWSALPLAPFDRGLILVADGIGSTYADVHRQSTGSQFGNYSSDADLPLADGGQIFPTNLAAQIRNESATFREGETVFQFDGLQMQTVMKRWIREHSPVFLYNYGFENQDSLGAIYSRVSSHIFGDWNACGKVMGMAPWAGRWQTDSDERPLLADSQENIGKRPLLADSHEDLGQRPILTGPLEDLQVDWQRLHAEPAPHQWADKKNHAAYARLSADVQADLEAVLLEYLTRLRKQTGEKNICLVGGVALNSTVNGRIAREAGFEQVFIPPWPGDDGIAMGCALFGHHQLQPTASPRRQPFTPYLGGCAQANDIDHALQDFAPWLQVESTEDRCNLAADAMADGQAIGWFQGRSEFGPRALGNRSILASPADGDMIDRINAAIKKRESFRPFAPTVLAEHASEFFADVTPSPYMSITVHALPEQADRIRAVVHVDGTARIQTLTEEQNPLYYELILAFQQRTGLPMVLNTSFNIKGEPIVETPADALRHFLASDLDQLFLEDRVIQKRPFPEIEELLDQRPIFFPGFTAEVVSSSDGEAMQISLMGHGENWESDQLELGVLEACNGEMTVAELLSEFEAEFEVEPAEVLQRLEQLYRRRLLHLED